ncbi:MAG: hypothetical protein ACR2L6_00740 [Gemmatimonadaceae bacterium]
MSRVILVALFLLGLLSESSIAAASAPRWGDVTGPVTATSLGIRIPTTLAQVATLTRADEQRIRGAVTARLSEVEALIATGAVAVRSEVVSAQAFPPKRGLFSLRATHLFSAAACGIWWVDWPGSGTQVRGGGWTRSNQTASLGVSPAKFFKDGSHISSFNISTTGTNAENYTDWDWRAWWEPQHNYVVQSWHFIYAPGGGYDYGPAYCEYQAFK